MQPKARDRARQDGPLALSVLREARVVTSRTTKRAKRPGICRAFSHERDPGAIDFGQEENLQIEIDRDGEIPVEMARRLLWEHQGIEFPGDIPWYLQPQRPASPPREEQVSPEAAPREEPFGLSSWESLQAVYQVLHEEMQEELDSDRHFFIENPNRAHMVRAAFPLEARLLREKAHTQEGPGTIPDGEMAIVVKELAPGLRLRLRLPPGMADGWKSVQSPDLFAILDEERSQHMWERCTGK